jgi:hypothetical protein
MRRLISNSFSSQSVPIIEIASWRSRRSPLGQPRNGERCPPRRQGGIKHVAAGEVLDQKTRRGRASSRTAGCLGWGGRPCYSKSSEGQCLFATRFFEARDVLESADRQA